VTAGGQDGDRDAPDPAGRAGDEDGTGAGLQAALLEGEDAERRGEPGRADAHGLPGGEAGGEGDDPVGRDPGVLREAAVVGHAQVVAVHHDGLVDGQARRARVDDRAGQVDPEDQR
jgi:hypothetical protein